MLLPLILTVCRSIRSTSAPIPLIASSRTLISLTSGRLSIVTVSSVIIAAARIASAAFFAPPISTSPTSGLPPLIIYCSAPQLTISFPLKYILFYTSVKHSIHTLYYFMNKKPHTFYSFQISQDLYEAFCNNPLYHISV